MWPSSDTVRRHPLVLQNVSWESISVLSRGKDVLALSAAQNFVLARGFFELLQWGTH